MVVGDLSGPIRKKYISTIIDVYSRFLSIKIVKHKSEVAQHVMDWVKWAQTQTQAKVKHFHTDGGGEYMSNALKQFFIDNGTTTSVTTRDTPQHNGIAERKILTLIEMARSMLHFASLPVGYSENAVHTATYIINRCVPRSLVHENKTRIEAFFGHKPSIAHMRTFGCNVYMHIGKKYKENKMDYTSHPCVLLLTRFTDTTTSYMIHSRVDNIGPEIVPLMKINSQMEEILSALR